MAQTPPITPTPKDRHRPHPSGLRLPFPGARLKKRLQQLQRQQSGIHHHHHHHQHRALQSMPNQKVQMPHGHHQTGRTLAPTSLFAPTSTPAPALTSSQVSLPSYLTPQKHDLAHTLITVPQDRFKYFPTSMQYARHMVIHHINFAYQKDLAVQAKQHCDAASPTNVDSGYASNSSSASAKQQTTQAKQQYNTTFLARADSGYSSDLNSASASGASSPQQGLPRAGAVKYELPEFLVAVRGALGVDTWAEYVRAVELFVYGAIREEELERKRGDLFRESNRGVVKKVRVSTEEMIRKWKEGDGN
ncbi:hypothetical protein P154DRAFT_258240 [Amniculicola lignicola CBS 123094]|uniref:Uncharacterized protein n=1 Tax=Amniculicola lignicola CBS 123094 TaxID=1392246 RepID=A0A6A5WXQ7_9PLEO|nr:hypothetical protein P154DRAFT_258240 [Amniculicola lignicola CBS 123094]